MASPAGGRLMATARVGGVELYYEISGSGEPVVLLHGLGSSVLDWEPQVAALSEHFRVVAVDLRGHGRSEKPAGPYSIGCLAADVAGLLSQLGTGPAHFVGLSMGGMVAFQLAAEAPDLVRSLVIINSGPAFPGRTVKGRLVISSRLLMIKAVGMRGLGSMVARSLFPALRQAALRRAFAERYARNDPRAYASAVRAIAGWNVTDRLESIRCPTLVMASDRDYTPVSAKEAYVRRLANAKLVVIRDSRHACTLDQPLQVNAALLDFLRPAERLLHGRNGTGLRGKVAIVTGAAAGIGRATALRFAAEGVRVAAWDVAEAEALPGELRAMGGEGLFRRVDVTDPAAVVEAVEEVRQRWGRIDVLVNNAGIVRDAQLVKWKDGAVAETMSDGAFDAVVSVNLKGVFHCTRAVAPHMIAGGGGVVLNASSVVGLYGNFGQTNYAATKAGVISMTRTWARELGRFKVRVNAVAPGFVATEIVSAMPEKVLRSVVEHTPLGRMGRPEDIAEAYVWLASDHAAFVHGAVLSVDGGLVVGT